MSPLTLEAYENDLKFWTAHLREFSEQSVFAALKILDEQKFKESTKHRKRAVLRSYLRFGAYSNPSWNKLVPLVPMNNQSDLLPKALSIEEVRQLLNCAEMANVERAERDYALLNLLYSAGLRISEALALRWTDLDEQKQILCAEGKGSKQRLIPYSERSARALEKFKSGAWEKWRKNQNQKMIFISPRGKVLSRMGAWKIVSYWSQQAGIGHIHPHVLRHSFATHLLAGGADVRVVQALLGHSSINTTERYLKIDDQDVRKLFADFHPLG